MRIKLLSFFLFSMLFGYAQSDSIVEEFTKIVADTPDQVYWHSSFTASSNSLNTGMMGDYLFSDRFKSKHKEAFNSNKAKTVRLYAQSSNGLTYYRNREKPFSIEVEYVTEIFGRSSEEGTRVALFGNSAFEAQEVSLNSSNLVTLDRLQVLIGKPLRRDSLWRVTAYGGLIGVLDMQALSVGKGSMYTHTSGEYIDIVAENTAFYNKQAGLDGLGLNFGFTVKRTLNSKSSIWVAMYDLAPLYLFGSKTYHIDTSFRFQGIPLTAEQLFKENVGQIADSTINAVLYSDSSQKHLAFIPAKSYLTYSYELNHRNSLRAQLHSIYGGFFGYSFKVSHLYNFPKGILVESSLMHGNFTGLVWSERLMAVVRSHWFVSVKAYGLNSLISQTSSSAAGISFGLSKTL